MSRFQYGTLTIMYGIVSFFILMRNYSLFVIHSDLPKTRYSYKIQGQSCFCAQYWYKFARC